jgi:ATP-binding protein involved in chromosome partitioning
VLDADIWGFSVPRMLGISDRLEAERSRADKPRIIPNERSWADGTLKVVSTGFLVEDEGTALMWRGLMLTKAVEQFLRDVHWGELDYLLIDMPPGTGDVQMGLARMLPRTDLVIVTTPTLAAQKVAIRAADMARRSFLRVAGVIENMSAFTCDHGTAYALFGEGGGQALADEIGAELLGQVPARAGRGVGWRRGHARWRSTATARRPRRSAPSPAGSSTRRPPPVRRHGRAARPACSTRRRPWPSDPDRRPPR